MLPSAVLTAVAAERYCSAAMVLGYCDTVALCCCGTLLLRYLGIETLCTLMGRGLLRWLEVGAIIWY